MAIKFLAQSKSVMCVTSARRSNGGTVFFDVFTQDGHLRGSQSVEINWLEKCVNGDCWDVCFATADIQNIYESLTESLIVPTGAQLHKSFVLPLSEDTSEDSLEVSIQGVFDHSLGYGFTLVYIALGAFDIVYDRRDGNEVKRIIEMLRGK